MASDEMKKYEARWQAFHFLEKNNKDNPKKRVEGIRAGSSFTRNWQENVSGP